MRILALSVGGVVVVIAVVLLLFPLARKANSEVSTEDAAVVEESIDTLKSELRDVRRRIEELDARLKSMEEVVVALNERLDDMEKGDGGSAGSASDSEASSKEKVSGYAKVAAVVPSDVERLREIIREEMKRAEESRRRQIVDSAGRKWRILPSSTRSAEQPEEWEKEAFGNYAWYIHRRGKELGLTDNQKQLYYSIIKDYYDKVGRLWKKIRDENPDADWREIQRIYRERSTEMLKETRESVMRILDAEQQEKYRKMFQDDKWYR